MMRKIIVCVCFSLLVIGLVGCSNPQKKAAKAAAGVSKAEQDVHKQKAKILGDYRKCLKKNKSDENACASYKKSLDSL